MRADDVVRHATDLVTRTQKELARAIGVTPQVISQWRRGLRNPHPHNLRSLADWFENEAKQLSEAANALRRLAGNLEDPELREQVTSTEREKVPAAKRVRDSPPPQFRQRSGCAWVIRGGRRAVGKAWRRLRGR